MRLDLPLIDQARHIPRKYETRIESRSFTAGDVGIEQDLRGRNLAGRFRLPTGLRAFDDDRTGRFQSLLQLSVGQTRSVFRGLHSHEYTLFTPI
ncbi:MAG TPA: hypothetical protein VFC52_02690, partial [Solirubrobacterales bacterium]|nr:hypothetical protein [Solirubrobacterales bacterium]